MIKVLLPTAETSQNLNKQQISLTVTAEKRYYLNQTEVSLSLLENALKEQIKGFEGPTIILRFAKSLNVQDLVDVLEIGVKLNLKMVMATDKS